MGGQLQQFTEMLCWLADARDISTGVASASRTPPGNAAFELRDVATDGQSVGSNMPSPTMLSTCRPRRRQASRLTPAHIKPLDPRLPPSHRLQGLSLVPA